MTSTNPSFSPTSLESVDLLSFDQRASNSEELQSPSSNLEQIEEVQQQQTQTEESLNTIYQIDFDVEHVGKNKPQSKRVAIWRYQMNGDHETKLTWSTHRKVSVSIVLSYEFMCSI